MYIFLTILSSLFSLSDHPFFWSPVSNKMYPEYKYVSRNMIWHSTIRIDPTLFIRSLKKAHLLDIFSLHVLLHEAFNWMQTLILDAMNFSFFPHLYSFFASIRPQCPPHPPPPPSFPSVPSFSISSVLPYIYSIFILYSINFILDSFGVYVTFIYLILYLVYI